MVHLFKKEDGSTALTIVISLALVVALLSVAMQWYWVNSSSSDVQLMADIGAMAEQEAIGRAVLLMQIIDVTILTANLLGILIHAIVVVAGVATTVSAPLGGFVSAEFLSKAIEIDNKYVARRKDFVDQLFAAAEKINSVVPYLAFGYSNKLVAQNDTLRKTFNRTPYGVVPIPFPAQGKVIRKSGFTQDDAILASVSEASATNAKTAQTIKALEEKVEELKRAAYDADVYKSADDTYQTWEVQNALADYSQELDTRMNAIVASSNSLTPIEETSSSAQERINKSYEQDEETLRVLTLDAYAQAFGPNARPLVCNTVSLDAIYQDVTKATYYLLDHNTGERKAYHSDSKCSGLLNAHAQLNEITLSEVIGCTEHPPCSICMPFHWEVISHFKEGLSSFESNWNQESQILNEYENTSAQLNKAQQEIQNSTQNAFTVLLNEAAEMIASDRLSYQPPGSRGVICVAFSQQKRNAPSFTLARLTRSDDSELGVSVAISAARLKPVDNEHVASIVESQQKDYRPKTLKYGSVIFGFLDMDAGFFSQLSGLWSGATQFFLKGSSSFNEMFAELPWGLGAIAQSFMTRLEKIAGLSKPDLSTYRPFLVNTSNVGDKNAPGFEGTFVKELSASKDLLSKESAIADSKTAELVEFALGELPNDSDAAITAMSKYLIFDQPVLAPFWQGLSTVSSNAIQWSKTNVLSFLRGQ